MRKGQLFGDISTGDVASASVTESVVRAAFGGTIYPRATIEIEPLIEAGRWWIAVESNTENQELDEWLRPWRALVRWFATSEHLRSPVWVSIGDEPLDDDFANGGSTFPRLAIAITEAGSLVGISGWVVHT